MSNFDDSPNGNYLCQLKTTIWQIVGIYIAVVSAGFFVAYAMHVARL